ncbi:MAG: metal-dependent transcriptional regulator [Chloroflexota bacterium]|nr:MAG: metal-dependent transcriptional regulator [Chloroflexota bacterium]
MPEPLLAIFIAAALVLIGWLFFWPKTGLIPRWRKARQITNRVLLEDALKHIQRCERHGETPSLQSIAGALDISVNQAAQIAEELQSAELIQIKNGTFLLTPSGREYALRVIRAHRLWEEYLAEQTGFEESEWHDQAEKYEHLLSTEEARALAQQLGNPVYDPHGDPIPSSSGEFQHHAGIPLSAMELNAPLRIVHIEDEPEEIYAQLVAEGLSPGMNLRITEKTSRRIRFWIGDEEHVLAPVVAANISVVQLLEEQVEEIQPGTPLGLLKPGEQGQVVALSPRLRSADRRRMMDLGILPGTIIDVEMTSPSGDPSAYKIRGALIALRKEQANLIQVETKFEALPYES